MVGESGVTGENDEIDERMTMENFMLIIFIQTLFRVTNKLLLTPLMTLGWAILRLFLF